MQNLILEAWIAGLFEGEGTFTISKGKAKGISITSTDLDVLKRIQDYCGGTIYTGKIRNPKWKISYVWAIRTQGALKFLEMVKPFLLSRRLKRSIEWVEGLPKGNKNEKIILELFNQGFTHEKIALQVGLTRSTISHFLRKRGLRRL